jgi:DNA-binding MarR family transcriptional regulator
MPTNNQTLLSSITRGEATPSEARAAISLILEKASAQTASQIYVALRSWVWKALDGRRRDKELREWFDILKRASAFLELENKNYAERLHVLHELLFESISASDIVGRDEVLKRDHVLEVLGLFQDDPEKQLDRTDIGERLKLKQANLTRVLNIMCVAGLIERVAYGRRATFQLTRSGSSALADVRSAKQSVNQDVNHLALKWLFQNSSSTLKRSPLQNIGQLAAMVGMEAAMNALSSIDHQRNSAMHRQVLIKEVGICSSPEPTSTYESSMISDSVNTHPETGPRYFVYGKIGLGAKLQKRTFIAQLAKHREGLKSGE